MFNALTAPPAHIELTMQNYPFAVLENPPKKPAQVQKLKK